MNKHKQAELEWAAENIRRTATVVRDSNDAIVIKKLIRWLIVGETVTRWARSWGKD